VGIVCITEAFLRLKAEGFVPRRDLILVFSGDEETTQQTAADLAKNHRDLIDAEFALNSDSGRAYWMSTMATPSSTRCRRREVLCELRTHRPQSGWAQLAPARRQCHL